MIYRRILSANARQASRLASLKIDDGHLWAPKGLMIDDPETVARIAVLAHRLGISKRDVVKMACGEELARLDRLA